MWQEKVLNPQIIKSLFKDEELSLEGIKVYSIQFVIGSDLMCVMNYSLADYLKNPPSKWAAKGYDTVQMQLSFIQSSIRVAELKGSISAGTLSIQCIETGFEINYMNHENGDKLTFDCTWIHVDKVEGYARSC